ncbi:MAG: SPFH domain-containing protein [Saprospiraceae bacterium]|nr:SPFH domain-containing protein [Saprospiraceae bacterium]
MLPILVFLGFLLVTTGLFTVKQQTAAIIQRFGKFHSIRQAGLHFKIPFVDTVAGKITMKIQQLDVPVETKTKDDVFVSIKVSVQYLIKPDSIYDAFYKLQNPYEQMSSYIFDVVRAEVPKMKLDDVFERKDDIAVAIKRELDEAMNEYGYYIVKALVTDIDPAAAVKEAMNHINAAERKKTAAEYEGEAEKIRIVAKARAEAESKRLQGQGIADQRREIARGLVESVGVLNNVGINSQEASALIVITQHYDTLHSVGENANSNLILLPNAPSAATDMLSQMVASFVATNQMSDKAAQDKKLK